MTGRIHSVLVTFRVRFGQEKEQDYGRGKDQKIGESPWDPQTVFSGSGTHCILGGCIGTDFQRRKKISAQGPVGLNGVNVQGDQEKAVKSISPCLALFGNAPITSQSGISERLWLWDHTDFEQGGVDLEEGCNSGRDTDTW